MTSKKESSSKIKEAIGLLSAALLEHEETGHVKPERLSNDASSSETGCSQGGYTSRESSRALSACSKALDTLAHLRQMRLAEQKSNFQSYQDDKRNKRSTQVEPLGGTSSKVLKTVKTSPWSHKFVCLASKDACRAPSSAEKCLLSSFDLGEKVIKFTSFQTTMLDEFQDILKGEYPQLELCGGFDLLRCKPNSRELEEIPFMVTYPLPCIQQHVSNGRIYIRPLQNDIKLESDDEIEWITEYCHKCKKEVPIAELRTHLKDCSRRKDNDQIYDCDDDQVQDTENIIQSQEDTSDAIATSCYDTDGAISAQTYPVVLLPERKPISESMPIKTSETLADKLHRIRENRLVEDIYVIEVRRDSVLYDSLKSVKRASFSPVKTIKASFVGEPGEDGGGPGRELWSLLGIAFRDQVCHGVAGSVTFLHDSKGILEQKFMHLGQLVAISVIQAGAVYPFLSNATFQYICGKGISEIDFSISDIPDPKIRELVAKIQDSTCEYDLKELLFDNSEMLAEAGYTKPLNQVSLENKAHLIHALSVHFGLLIVKAEIDQFKEGLLKGMQLLMELQKNPELFVPVFTCAGEKPLTAEIILGLFTIKSFSTKGSNEYKKEENTYMLFRDLIDDYEINSDTISLEEVLSFFTGATRIPIGGFGCEATLKFSQDAYYPSASTCALQLVLPTQYHNNESLFKERCSFAFKNPCGFGMC